MPFDRAIFGDRRVFFLEKPFERNDLIARIRDVKECAEDS